MLRSRHLLPSWLMLAIRSFLLSRQATPILVGLASLLLVGLTYLAAGLILTQSFERVEKDAVWKNTKRVQDAIQNELQQLDTTLSDWSTWDDTYQFIQSGDRQYVIDNLQDATFQNLRIDLMLFIGPQQSQPSTKTGLKQTAKSPPSKINIVYARHYDFAQGIEKGDIPAALLAYLQAQELSGFGLQQDSRYGIIVLPEGPLLMAINSISDTARQAPPKGALLMGRFLNDAEMQRISKLTSIQAEIATFTHYPKSFWPPAPQVVPTRPRMDQYFLTQAVSHDKIYGYLPLVNLDHQPVLWLRTMNPRVIYQQGQLSLRYLSLSLGGIGLVAGTVIYLLSRRLQNAFASLEARVEQRTHQLALAKNLAELAKEEADRANRAKSEFLANMSHELRTPLNAVIGFSELMMHDISLDSLKRENLRTINRSGDYLLSLINDILDMSKIEAGQTVLSKNVFDLFSLIEVVEDVLRLKADAKGIELIIDISPNTPRYILADERKLHQILLNLLGNAVKFTQQGYVRAKVEALGSAAQPPFILNFEIQDTGPGIPPHDLDKLFEPFIQTEAGRQAQQGAGLGLTISRKFVQLMGGDILVKSVYGQGSTFSFGIQVEPVQTGSIQKQRSTRRVLGLQAGQPTYRILVVDDRWTNRQLLVQWLVAVGFEVREAENGQEAVALTQAWKPHLIWMDMRMPVMDGYEATRRIRSLTEGKAIAIIGLTASVMEEERIFVLTAGCDDFVRKPIRQDVLFETMERYLGVRYLAEDLADATTLTVSTDELTPEKLATMPTDWLIEFKVAAVKLDAQQITGLIAQLPKNWSVAKLALKAKVDNFDFEYLMRLADQALILCQQHG